MSTRLLIHDNMLTIVDIFVMFYAHISGCGIGRGFEMAWHLRSCLCELLGLLQFQVSGKAAQELFRQQGCC